MRSLRRRGLLGSVRHAMQWLATEVESRQKRRARQAIDERFDQAHGIDTGGIVRVDALGVTGENVQHAVQYQPVFPEPVNEVMKQLPVDGGKFIFVDFGSGKGRALLLASEFPFRRIVGIEFSRQLHQTAEANWRKYRSRTQKCKTIELLCVDAVTYDIPPVPTVFFLYNPFREVVMKKVADRIHKSLQQVPRTVFVVYFNPQVLNLWSRIDALEIFPIRQPVWPALFRGETVEVWATRGTSAGRNLGRASYIEWAAGQILVFLYCPLRIFCSSTCESMQHLTAQFIYS